MKQTRRRAGALCCNNAPFRRPGTQTALVTAPHTHHTQGKVYLLLPLVLLCAASAPRGTLSCGSVCLLSTVRHQIRNTHGSSSSSTPGSQLASGRAVEARVAPAAHEQLGRLCAAMVTTLGCRLDRCGAHIGRPRTVHHVTSLGKLRGPARGVVRFPARVGGVC